MIVLQNKVCSHLSAKAGSAGGTLSPHDAQHIELPVLNSLSQQRMPQQPMHCQGLQLLHKLKKTLLSQQDVIPAGNCCIQRKQRCLAVGLQPVLISQLLIDVRPANLTSSSHQQP